MESGFDAVEWGKKSLGHSVYFRRTQPKPCVLCGARTTMEERYSKRPVCGKCCDAVTQDEYAAMIAEIDRKDAVAAWDDLPRSPEARPHA